MLKTSPLILGMPAVLSSIFKCVFFVLNSLSSNLLADFCCEGSKYLTGHKFPVFSCIFPTYELKNEMKTIFKEN